MKLVIEIDDAERKHGSLRLNGRTVRFAFDAGQGGLYLCEGITASARDHTVGGRLLQAALKFLVPDLLEAPEHRLWGKKADG